MKCIECGSSELFGKVTMNIIAPLAAKGGSIKVGGVKVTQIDVKNTWDHEGGAATAPIKEIRGPILCGCGCVMAYVEGHAANPVAYESAFGKPYLEEDE